MSIQSRILDGKGSGKEAKVTQFNQLVTAPLSFSEAFAVNADVVDTAFNVVGPEEKRRFVVTDIILYADKAVSSTDATVDLYEADSSTSTTSTKDIICLEIPKKNSLVITGINLILTEGVWLNLKTNDNNVFSTVMGYYVDI